jgi:hypothetical protein
MVRCVALCILLPLVAVACSKPAAPDQPPARSVAPEPKATTRTVKREVTRTVTILKDGVPETVPIKVTEEVPLEEAPGERFKEMPKERIREMPKEKQ